MIHIAINERMLERNAASCHQANSVEEKCDILRLMKECYGEMPHASIKKTTFGTLVRTFPPEDKSWGRRAACRG
jgi:hypothetical protein